MAFESGSVTCRMFTVPGGLPDDAVERFAAAAAPPVHDMGREPIEGWVTSRHLMDSHITDDSATVAGYLYLYLMQAERKIPPALMRAECRMEEFAEMQARGLAYLRRSERTEIKKAVIDRLLPQMPPTLKGIALVYDRNDQVLYASATSDKQHDALVLYFRNTTGTTPIPIEPDTAAMQRGGIHLAELVPTCFVPEFEYAGAPDTVGQDFLTWLWYASETNTISTALPDGCGVIIEGPLTFVFEGGGAHETTLRKGAPMVATEAKAALMAGKKLRRAVLTMAQGDAVWTTTIDADTFIFRGLKLPKGEAMDPIGKFEERMLALRVLREVFLGLFEHFLTLRQEPAQWEKTLADVYQWVEKRSARP
ncbi:MAG: recombination-associated protein RdgC [Kiritimatiellia bacterium]|nr:recombination-associated protein RdgC [Kiritimatiellia bacterium]MDP6629602.1 recombination-associated protein RdgC [Kiritimatiellia bacterium]MDP6809309.1 recombination-associated protein RdgC [Kiritimatiellia bacterium]MDP7023047.1 recombination-associated protein RdgC [Kiritimatiellia bacterium]